MKAASEREGEMPTTIALENSAQNPQEKNKKRKTYFQKLRIIKVTQKNHSNCMLGNKDQKDNYHGQAIYPGSHKFGFYPV